MDSPQAFDVLAPTYDQIFSQSPIGRWLRGRVHAHLGSYWREGQSVLELGCGTGEDTLHLAGRGIVMTATDSSDGMLEVTRQKTHALANITLEKLDLRELPDDKVIGPFDGAFANFGVINCLNDWYPLALWLARRVKPGGVIAFGVMSRFCLWEIGWHTLHLNFRTAFRRINGKSTFQPDKAIKPMDIYYPSARRLKHDFRFWFKQGSLSGLGLFLPPSDAFGFVEKRPRFLALLTRLETAFASSSRAAPFADHYWIDFTRLGALETTRPTEG